MEHLQTDDEQEMFRYIDILRNVFNITITAHKHFKTSDVSFWKAIVWSVSDDIYPLLPSSLGIILKGNSAEEVRLKGINYSIDIINRLYGTSDDR